MKEQRRKEIEGSLPNSDTVFTGYNFKYSVEQAIRHADSLLSHYIGQDNLKENYKLDSGFSEIKWIEPYNGELTSFSKRFEDLDQLKTDTDRYISSFEISYRLTGDRPFGIYLQFYANKKLLHIQGMIKMAPGRELAAILAKKDFLLKLTNYEGDKKLRKYFRQHISSLKVMSSTESIKNDVIFSNIYYELRLTDYKDPGRYKFDPWTGKLCCVIRDSVN